MRRTTNSSMRRRPLLLHLQVFPRIGVAGGDSREHVLPLLRHYLGADRVDERVTEHGHQVVVLEDPALDLLGELLALGRVDRALVLVELAVEVLHTDTITRVEAPALEVAFVPEGPASCDPDALEDDLGSGKLLEPALQPLGEDAALHGLEPAADADLAELRDDALASRVERGYRRYPVHVESVRIARLAQELFGFLHVTPELGPLDRVQDVVVDPVARRLAHPARLRLIHGAAIDSQAHRLADALVAERVLRVLEAGELDEERPRQHGRQRDAWKLADLVDELAGDVVDDVGLAALQHGDPGGRLGHRDHDELLGVDGTVVAVEGLHLDLHARLVTHELEGPRADRLLLEAVRAHLLVVLLGHNPAGAGDVGGAEQDREVEEWLLEDEADRAVVDDLNPIGLLLEHVGLRAPVVLVAELHVLRRDRLTVVELEPLAQRERRALRV